MNNSIRHQQLLDGAKQFIRQHRTNPLEQGNLFTVLDMENKEVSAHSAFLYFVFKPFKKADNLYDDFNLRKLLEVFLKAKGVSKNISSYKSLDIRREVSFEFGRLDFVITADDETFVIELKIWAGEQPQQIIRYQNYLIEQHADKNNIFFLTPSARKSQTGDSINITLKKDIRQCLCCICDKRLNDGYQKYATMIEQYISIIDKLTQGENCMRETLNIIETVEDIYAVEQLIDNRKNCLQQLLKSLFTKLKTQLGNWILIDGLPKAKVITYMFGQKSIDEYYSGGSYYPAIVFEIADCKLKDDCTLKENVKLYFLVEVSDNLYCGISPRNTQQSQIENINCKDAFSAYSTLKKYVKNKDNNIYIAWEHLYYNNHKINFTIRELNGKNSFLCLLEENSLEISNKKVTELVAQIKQKYSQFCKEIFDLNKIQ